MMFIVETRVFETAKGCTWKKDRTYKIFEHAEKRVYDLYAQGKVARMVEKE